MATQAVLNEVTEGKPISYTGLIFDQSLVNVFDEASEPLNAFVQILDGVDGDFVPHEGYPRLCAKVLAALLDQERRVIAQAVKFVDGQVGKIVLNAHDHAYENQQARIAGQYCRARIATREVHHG